MTLSVRFVGTATTILRIGSFTLLTDPNFLHREQFAYLGYGLASRRLTEPALQPHQLPPLDAVVLSHLHGDHFDRVARRGLPRDLPIVTTAHGARRLDRWGFTTHVLENWQTHRMVRGDETLTVVSVPAAHAFGVLGRLLPPVMGSVLEYVAGPGARPLRLYLSGDTLFHRGLAEIGEAFPSLDLAIIHLGGLRGISWVTSVIGCSSFSGQDFFRFRSVGGMPRSPCPQRRRGQDPEDRGTSRDPGDAYPADQRQRRPGDERGERVHAVGEGAGRHPGRDRGAGALVAKGQQCAHPEADVAPAQRPAQYLSRRAGGVGGADPWPRGQRRAQHRDHPQRDPAGRQRHRTAAGRVDAHRSHGVVSERRDRAHPR